MKSTLLTLLKLSEIDTQLLELKEQHDVIPASIQELTRQINTLEAAMRNAESRKSDLEKTKSEGETFIREKKEWIETREGQVKDLKTNKEYHAALKEVAVAKKEILDRETLLTSVNQQIEQVQTEAQTLRDKNAAEIESLKNKIAEFEAQLASMSPLLEEKKKARVSASAEIDPKAMTQYEQILARIAPAISKAEGGICTECGTKILPQVFNKLFNVNEIIPCPRCKRILYVEEVLK